MTIKFRDAKHEQDYIETLAKMKSQKRYNQALAYLFTLDEECFRHINDLYSFERDEIKPMGATYLAWQMSGSVRTTRLAFNLWSDIKADYDKDAHADDSSMSCYTIGEILSSSYVDYYLEALKIRFAENMIDG